MVKRRSKRWRVYYRHGFHFLQHARYVSIPKLINMSFVGRRSFQSSNSLRNVVEAEFVTALCSVLKDIMATANGNADVSLTQVLIHERTTNVLSTKHICLYEAVTCE
jgi:hypothetical protein